MPGGYGTSGPWGTSGDSYVTGSTPPGAAGNSSSNNNNSSNNYYSNPDKDYDDSWESQPNNYVEPYTPHTEIYGPKQAGTNESYEWTHEYGMSGPKINALIQDLSPQTLAFWGINANSQTIPNELFQMILEGSIVGSNEAMFNDIDPNEPGIQLEPGVGTWSDLEFGTHPSLPGGMSTYYQLMNLPTTVTYENTSSSGGGGGGGGGGRGWGGWSGSWGGPGGYGTGIGGAYSRRWNPHMKNVNNFGSDIAKLFAQKEANKYTRPTNHWMFTQMLQSMPGGGITEAI